MGYVSICKCIRFYLFFQSIAYFLQHEDCARSSTDTYVAKLIGQKRSEKEVLSENLMAFPSWVVFPDFCRVEWLNNVIQKLWPELNQFVNDFVKEFIEPEINCILNKMSLNQVSKFQVIVGGQCV